MPIFAPIDAIETDDAYGLTVSAAVLLSSGDIGLAQEVVDSFPKDDLVLREMNRVAAGLISSVAIVDGFLRVAAKVVDETVISKVKHRVLRGFEISRRFISLVDRPGSLDKVSLWKATMNAEQELALDDHADAMNQVNPNRLAGARDFSTILGETMKGIAEEASARLTVAMTAAMEGIQVEVNAPRRRADAIASDPGGATGLRSRQARLSGSPEPGATGYAANVVSLPAIQGRGSQEQNAREISRPFTKADYSAAAKAMLAPNDPPGERRIAKASTSSAAGPDAFTAALTRDVHGLMNPNRSPRVPPRVVAPSYKPPTSGDPRTDEFMKAFFDGANAHDLLLKPND
jgi:hypothetical protein